MKKLFVSIVIAAATNTSHSSTLSEQDLVGAWQFGLNQDTRHIPTGHAFRTGITAAVLTLNPDKTLRIETPCRDENFTKKFGELQLAGRWALTGGDMLALTLQHMNETKLETYLVNLRGDQMTLTADKTAPRELGRFTGATGAVCEY